MKNLAVCTIQRNRANWIEEWIAFHHVVGFRKFYFFLHKTNDDSKKVLENLKKIGIDISIFNVDENSEKPQLEAYRYCYQNFNHLHKWIAFIDGDEFLFSPKNIDIWPEIEKFEEFRCGAIGVFWTYFGSSKHINEPKGLITQNYRWKADKNFSENNHFKSIVRGGLGSHFCILDNSHFFRTRNGGTVDEQFRKLSYGYARGLLPSSNNLRINHYGTQSYEYFKNFKQDSGCPDVNTAYIRPDSWFAERDQNIIFDNSLDHIMPYLHEFLAMHKLQRCMEAYPFS